MTPAPLPQPLRTGGFQPLLATLSRWSGPLLLFAIMVLAFWRILLTDQYTWLNGFDLSAQVLPWLQFQASEWHAGRLPLWSPYEWGGQNLIGQGQPGVLNPLNWLLFAAPLRRGWLREGVLHWWFFLLHFIASLNLYFLARTLGAGRLPAVFGGLCFGLLGFLGSNDWPQMLSGIIWAPLVLAFLFRARNFAPWRNAAWAGLFFGLSWLSGHHQLPIFMSLGTLGIAIALRIYSAVLTFAIGGLIAAPQLLTGIAYGKLAVRWVGMENPVTWKDKVAYFVHDQYANPPAALLSLVLPGAESHTSLFIGLTALVLATWAIRAHWSRPEVRALLGLGIAALLYNLGRAGGLEPLFYSLIPMVEKARSPSMAGAMFTLSFSALAAIGFELLRHKHVPQWFEHTHWIFGGAVVALFSFSKLLPASGSQLEQRWFMVAVVSLGIGCAYAAHRRGALSLRSLLSLLVVALWIESANMTYFNMGNRHDKNVTDLLTPMSKHMDVREFLLTRPAPVRVTVDNKAIPYNFGDWHGVDVMGGYLASLTQMHTEADWLSPRGRMLAGIGYHVGPTAPADQAKLLFQGSAGVNVWEYPRQPLPRAWVATTNVVYRTPAEFSTFVENENFDLARTVLSRQPIPNLTGCQATQNTEAVVLQHNPGEVLISASTPCRGVLVLADSYESGWSVLVDGQPAQALQVYNAFRGVELAPGRHLIQWSYSPTGFRPGLAAAALGLLLFTLCQFRAVTARLPGW